MADFKTDDVFGIQRDVPLNYVTRPDVDEVFISSLTRDKHIVIYGSSKQGKTSLRKYSLKPDDYITVSCDNKSTLAQLHSSILKAAGYTIEVGSTTTTTGERKISAKLSGELNLGFGKVGGEAGGEEGGGDQHSYEEKTLELEPDNVNDIIGALNDISFGKYIVLEDFHYLPMETQEAFAFALKAFHENSSFTFIIVGVWLDENRLIQFNGDLTGRVLAVDADAWSSEELHEVIGSGERMLNVEIDPTVKNGIVAACFDSVYIVQDACHRICIGADVFQTQPQLTTIGAGTDVEGLVRAIVNEQSARYNAFLENFSTGFQETTLEMHRWLLLAVLVASATSESPWVRWRLLTLETRMESCRRTRHRGGRPRAGTPMRRRPRR